MSATKPEPNFSETYTYFEGSWHEGNIPILGVRSPASWLAQVVFDGARSFDGVAPDLDLHCQRVIDSATQFGMETPISLDEMIDIAWEGIRKFPKEKALYIRPMLFAGDGFIAPEPGSTQFVMCVWDAPFPGIEGFSACISSFRRPSPETAPTEAKASCLYPNVARCLQEAARRGFDNAVVRDLNGNVAEFATANLFIAKDGVVHTPAPNGTFLAGITRQRVIQLLRGDGYEVRERRITVTDVLDADEAFSTGNYTKIMPATRIEDRDLQPGPVARTARDLYFAWSKTLESRYAA